MAHSGGKRRQTIPVTVRQAVMEAFERNGRVCSICGETVLQGVDIHIDHNLPVSRGGTNEVTNLYVAHASCNLSKGKRTEEEYDEVRYAREALADSMEFGELGVFNDGPANSSRSLVLQFPEDHVYTLTRRNWRWSVTCSCGSELELEQKAYTYEIDALVTVMRHDTLAWAALRSLEFKREPPPHPFGPIPVEWHQAISVAMTAPGVYAIPTERWVGRCVCGWYEVALTEKEIDAAVEAHREHLL